MSGWFAITHGIRKHPIFKGRPERLGAWVAMLDEAAFTDTVQDVGGVIVPVLRGELCASQSMLEDITGLSRQQLRTFMAALEKAGSIATRPATKSTKSRTIITFCNYGKHQHDQPSSNQAATKQQPTKEQGNKVTKEEEAKASLSAEPTLPDLAHVDEISQAVSAYNEAAQTAGWAKVQKLSRERRSKLAARLREAGGIEGWRVAMSKARASPLCTGDNERGWVASFDFLISKEKFTRLMEGQYDDRRSSRPDHRTAANSHPSDRAIAFASRAVRTPSKDCF